MVEINPSILSADFVNLQSELEKIASADGVHVDVMDNHFVPNLTIGLPVVERIAQCSPVPLDIHLMITDADTQVLPYAKIGPRSITFHIEASKNPAKLIRELKDLGVKVAVAFKPGTALTDYLDLLPMLDMILVMTVEPGFGGQSFMPEMLAKVRKLAEIRKAKQLNYKIQVDGGISPKTIGEAAVAGADVFVAGSAVYNGEPAVNIKELREKANAALKS